MSSSSSGPVFGASGEGAPTPHAMPYYCPYCGEQDIRPGEDERTYHCRTCDRLWKLEFRRLGAPANG